MSAFTAMWQLCWHWIVLSIPTQKKKEKKKWDRQRKRGSGGDKSYLPSLFLIQNKKKSYRNYSVGVGVWRVGGGGGDSLSAAAVFSLFLCVLSLFVFSLSLCSLFLCVLFLSVFSLSLCVPSLSLCVPSLSLCVLSLSHTLVFLLLPPFLLTFSLLRRVVEDPPCRNRVVLCFFFRSFLMIMESIALANQRRHFFDGKRSQARERSFRWLCFWPREDSHKSCRAVVGRSGTRRKWKRKKKS